MIQYHLINQWSVEISSIFVCVYMCVCMHLCSTVYAGLCRDILMWWQVFYVMKVFYVRIYVGQYVLWLCVIYLILHIKCWLISHILHTLHWYTMILKHAKSHLNVSKHLWMRVTVCAITYVHTYVYTNTHTQMYIILYQFTAPLFYNDPTNLYKLS